MSNGNLNNFKFTEELSKVNIPSQENPKAQDEVTRVYRKKNSRVTKELDFQTKRNRPKLT